MVSDCLNWVPSDSTEYFVLAAQSALQPGASDKSMQSIASLGSRRKSVASERPASKMSTPTRNVSRHDSSPVLANSPPKTPSRASSNKQSAVIRQLTLSRPLSPFQAPAENTISPSQSILNLSQRGLASARRQQWEATSKSAVPTISPLRLSKHSGSAAPMSRTPTRPSSIRRNDRQDEADRIKGENFLAKEPMFSEEATRMLSVKNLDKHKTADSTGVSTDNQETISPQRHSGDLLATKDLQAEASPGHALSNSKTIRKPAPPLKTSLSRRSIRSPSQAPTMQSHVTAVAVSGESATQQSTGAGERMKRTLEGSGPPTPAKSGSGSETRNSTVVAPAATDAQNLGARRDKSPLDLSTTPHYPYSGSTTSPASIPDVNAGHPSSNMDPSPPTYAPTSAMTGLHRLATSGELEHRTNPLSVRNPDAPDDEELGNSASFEPGQDDASYFNYPTGIGISAMPPSHEQPFALAKTYSDLYGPIIPGNGYAIPTSPDLGEQTSRRFTDKMYSKSPLSKSPGKGIMGKMVGAAKRVVNTGIRSRTGNFNRILHGDHLPLDKAPQKHRINLDDESTVSLVPSAVQRQEAQELQPHWGQEEYLLWGKTAHRDYETQSFPVDLPPAVKERELPVSPKTKQALDSLTDQYPAYTARKTPRTVRGHDGRC